MVRGLLARSRLLSRTCAVACAAAVLAGCGTTTPAVTVSGNTLTIYLSAPESLLSGNPEAQDVLNASQLAVSQLKGQVNGFTLNTRVLKGKKISDNARTAIEDKTSVGYVGEVKAGASTDSLGITNAEDLLQVSPAEGGPVPTNDFQSYSTYGRTFASMAPGSNQQAQTLVGGSAGRAFVRDFRSMYGHAPSAQAIFGYAASAAVLKALQKAGSAANNRSTVRNDFFALKNVPLLVGPGGPQLGTYTVNKDGTVTITPATP